MDREALERAARETAGIVVVEDHFAEGGIGDAVRDGLRDTKVPVRQLAVRQRPRSGSTEAQLDWQGMSRQAIVDAVRELVEAS